MGYELEIAEGQVERHTVRMTQWTTAWLTVMYCLTGRFLCNRQDNMLRMRRIFLARYRGIQRRWWNCTMKIVNKWHQIDQVKGDDVGGTCSIHGSCDN